MSRDHDGLWIMFIAFCLAVAFFALAVISNSLGNVQIIRACAEERRTPQVTSEVCHP